MQSATDAGPQLRFREMWDAHEQAITGYCLRRASREDARDAVAETFAIAWKRLDQVPQGREAEYWLYAVAGRVLSNQSRQSTRRARFMNRMRRMNNDPEPSAEVLVIRRAEEQRVIDAAARLRRVDREILLLAAWEELPHAAIGEVLGLNTAAVAQRLARAKKRLAKEFRSLADSREGAS